MRIALDTNVLLRIANNRDPLHPVARSAYVTLVNQHHTLYFTMQNIAEFWSVVTRPHDKNGYGLSVSEADSQIRDIESWLQLLPEVPNVYAVWRKLVVEQRVSGKEVHDVRLVAALHVHEVNFLLTWNGDDFKRFSFLTCITPPQVLTGALL